jgi:hypothetical protein
MKNERNQPALIRVGAGAALSVVVVGCLSSSPSTLSSRASITANANGTCPAPADAQRVLETPVPSARGCGTTLNDVLGQGEESDASASSWLPAPSINECPTSGVTQISVTGEGTPRTTAALATCCYSSASRPELCTRLAPSSTVKCPAPDVVRSALAEVEQYRDADAEPLLTLTRYEIAPSVLCDYAIQEPVGQSGGCEAFD